MAEEEAATAVEEAVAEVEEEEAVGEAAAVAEVAAERQLRGTSGARPSRHG